LYTRFYDTFLSERCYRAALRYVQAGTAGDTGVDPL